MRRSLAIVAALSVLAACGGNTEDASTAESGTSRAVATPAPATGSPGPTGPPSASVSPSPSPAPSASTGPAASPSPSPSPNPAGSAGASDPLGALWHRTLDFSATAMATDGEGNAYVTGFAPYGRANEWGRSVAMVLEKTDPDGRQAWIRRWRSRHELYTDAAGFGVAVSPDGGTVYVTGERMIPPWEERRVRIWAYSPDGRLLWSRQTDRFAVWASAAASSAGVVVGGYGWVAAWGPDGDPLWLRTFEEPDGRHCDSVADVAIGRDGEVYAVGHLDLTPTCGEMEGGALEDADIVIQRRSASGDLVWSRILTDTETDNDWAFAVTADGARIFVAGVQDGRAWLARLSSEGDIVWERRWGRFPSMRPVDLSVAHGAVHVLVHRYSPDSARGTLILRPYGTNGRFIAERRARLGKHAWPTGVAPGPDGALYVIARASGDSGDLWLLTP